MTPGCALNVYKEVSWTSHDAVARVRRILSESRVGHAGTLDPLASGVLLIGVGRATKLLSYLMELPKTYRGTFVLGRRTSTGDSGGATVERSAVPALDLAQAQAAAQAFLGSQDQVPPMMSAVKQGGQRLYELARKGIEVSRPARRVEVYRFQITAVELPRVDFEVDCGKGTYVRTLVEDLAMKLGTLGSVECLERSAIGPFGIADSVRLISEPGSRRDGLLAKAIPMSEALRHLPSVRVDARWVHHVRQGVVPPRTGFRFEGPPRPEAPVRVLGPERELLALGWVEILPGPAATPLEDACTLRLERVL